MLDARFWDEYMLHYDAAITTLKPYREMIEQCASWGCAQAGEQIVDLGCGTGNLLARVAATQGSPSSLLGVERCGSAREIAESKLSDVRCRLIDANLDDPDTLDGLGRVDLGFMINVIYSLRDPARLLRKLQKLVRVGGRLIISNPYKPCPDRLLAAHETWREQATTEERLADDAHSPARAWMIDANTEIASLAVQRRVHFLGLERMRELLGGAGFVITKLDAHAYAGLNLLVEAVRVG